MNTLPAVRADGVSFSFGAHRILEKVSFEVSRNEVVAVIGPNGGGKTTLLKLLAGLLRPIAGRLEVLGTAPADARSRMGYMPQALSFDPAFPVSVREVVLMGLLGQSNAVWYSRADIERADSSLSEVGLGDLRHRQFSALSGGQRQRVLIARALVSAPEILLLDEPTASVDLASENQLRDLLDKLQRRMTILLVSHDVGFVADMVHNVLCVNRTVTMHPTSSLSGATIQELYNTSLRAVRHEYHRHGDCDVDHLDGVPPGGKGQD